MHIKTMPAALIVSLATTASGQDIHQGYSDTAPEYEVDGNVVSNVDTKAFLWNPRGKSDEELAARARFLADAADTRTPEQIAADAPIMARYADAVVINSLMPTSVGILGNTVETFTDGIERNRRAGVTHVSASIGAFWSVADMHGYMDNTDPVVDDLGLEKVTSTEAIRRANAEDRMTFMYNSQGFDQDFSDLDEVAGLHERGVMIANPIYNTENKLATGIEFNTDPLNPKGLTDLGIRFVGVANGMGMIVDVSHSSDKTAIDAAAASSRPIMASHNNAAAVYPMARNMSDEAIVAVGKTGGVVCTNGVGVFLSKDGNAQPETIAAHVVHTASLIGKEGTCFGSDYTHNLYDAMIIQVPLVDKYPPEKGFASPSQMAGIEDIWAVVRVLEDDYGWTEDEIRGFLGENLLRVYAANWGS